MKKLTTLAVCVALGLARLDAAGPNPAPASDDPMAGLNLGNGDSHSGGDAKESPFVAQFKGHLLVLDHDEAKDFDTANLKGVKYFAFYYSASWCPPCRAFSPKLVEFYSWFKKSHPNFEVILVGNDPTQDKMLDYMKTDRMAWPSFKYPDINQDGVSVKHYCGPGIPDLVLVDENGKVLSDSFNGQEYLGPDHVLEDIKKIVPRADGT